MCALYEWGFFHGPVLLPRIPMVWDGHPCEMKRRLATSSPLVEIVWIILLFVFGSLLTRFLAHADIC